VHTIGLVLRHTISFVTDPFYSHIFHSVEQACATRGLSLMHANVPVDASRIEELPPMIQRRQVQGLLVAGYFSPAFFKVLHYVGLPWVVIDHFDAAIRTDCVPGRAPGTRASPSS
jgi:LacI family transcriptional regulator